MRGRTPRLAMAADGGSLLGRVQRLLRLDPSGNSVPSGLLAIIGIAVVCISVIGVAASGRTERPQTTSVFLRAAPATQLAAALEGQAAPAPPSPARPAPAPSGHAATGRSAPEFWRVARSNRGGRLPQFDRR